MMCSSATGISDQISLGSRGWSWTCAMQTSIEGIADKGKLAGKDLIHHHAHRIQVAALIGRFAKGHFGRQVVGRTDNGPGLGQVG